MDPAFDFVKNWRASHFGGFFSLAAKLKLFALKKKKKKKKKKKRPREKFPHCHLVP